MTLFFYFILGAQMLSAVAAATLVLLQQGKGADAGTAAGGTSALTASSLLSRVTTGCVALFLVLTLVLGWLSAVQVPAAPAAISPVSAVSATASVSPAGAQGQEANHAR